MYTPLYFTLRTASAITKHPLWPCPDFLCEETQCPISSLGSRPTMIYSHQEKYINR